MAIVSIGKTVSSLEYLNTPGWSLFVDILDNPLQVLNPGLWLGVRYGNRGKNDSLSGNLYQTELWLVAMGGRCRVGYQHSTVHTSRKSWV